MWQAGRFAHDNFCGTSQKRINHFFEENSMKHSTEKRVKREVVFAAGIAVLGLVLTFLYRGLNKKLA